MQNHWYLSLEWVFELTVECVVRNDTPFYFIHAHFYKMSPLYGWYFTKALMSRAHHHGCWRSGGINHKQSTIPLLLTHAPQTGTLLGPFRRQGSSRAIVSWLRNGNKVFLHIYTLLLPLNWVLLQCIVIGCLVLCILHEIARLFRKKNLFWNT